MPIPKNFRYLLFLNLMSEFEAVSSICSQEKVHLEMLQSGWLRAFWSISQEQDFSYYRICVGTQFMTKLFFKFKKPYFWPIFGAKSFFQKPWLSRTSRGFLRSRQNSLKSYDPRRRKHPDKRQRKGRQTLFHRILPATTSYCF